MIDIIVVLLAVGACLGLSLTLLITGWPSRFHRSIAGVLLAVAGLCVGEQLISFDHAHLNSWLVVSLSSELLLVVILLDALTRLNRKQDLAGGNVYPWQRYAATIVAGGLGMWIVTVVMLGGDDSGARFSGTIRLTGQATYLFLLVIYAVSIAYMEGLLRTLRDPILYQVKFVLLGLGALAGFRIFALSQMVFHQGQRLDAAINGVAILVAVSLIAYGFSRAQFRSFTERVYVSPSVLYGSLTFLVVGLYLFVVGIVSQIVRSFDVSLGEATSVLFVFLALVAMTIVLLSRSARTVVRTIVARNFYRSKYDYRAKWLEVTEVFRERDSVDAIWDGLLGLLSRTFSAGRISVWHKIEAEGRFHQVRSTNTEPPPKPLEASHRLIQSLAVVDRPVVVEAVGLLPQDPFVQATRAVLCVPIRSESELIGLIALSGEATRTPYEQDDHDLLRAMSHHVGVLLAHARLAEDRKGSAELEALHRFSAFCLHDLKNLAARLSLVAQNSILHGQDPTFQESAMRTVNDTAKKMTALMSKLSLKSFQSPGTAVPEMVDMPSMIEDIVASLRERGQHWRITVEPVPSIMVVREEIQQVLLNILLNAKQAVGEEGEIRIALMHRNRAVVVMVDDTGCGIPPERLRSLFRPIQSSRPGGLGIGLYHCRRIVEAYSGVIQIRSAVGEGTSVRIELPLSSLSVVQPSDDRGQSVVSL